MFHNFYSYFLQMSSLILLVFLLQTAKFQASHPNIVLIIADDLGIGDVGCFGNDTIKTPNIDNIAKNGVKFTHHVAAEAICTPSRAAFMTGRYPIRMGLAPKHFVRVPIFVASSAGLPSEEITFARIAKKFGYKTAFIGKWHLGLSCSSYGDHCHHPNQHGFDHFYGLPLTNLRDFGDDPEISVLRAHNPHILRNCLRNFLIGLIPLLFAFKFSIIRMRSIIFLSVIFWGVVGLLWVTFSDFKWQSSWLMRNEEMVEHPIIFYNMTQRLVKEGIDFIDKNQNAPFLLVMSWLQVHTALHTAPENRGKSVHGFYGDNVEEMDWGVGEIVNALKTRGLLDHSLVYFTSDNGGHLEESHPKTGEQEGGWNGIYRGGKGQGGMDGGFRMPGLMMWPNVINPGSEINIPTSMMDINPTIASILGYSHSADRKIDGTDLLPLLTNLNNRAFDGIAHNILFHYCGRVIHSATYTRASDKSVWKLFFFYPNWNPGTQTCHFICKCEDRIELAEPLLFRIDIDPSEKNPISKTDPGYDEIVETINSAKEKHLATLEDVENDQYSVWNLMFKPWLMPSCGDGFPYYNCRDKKNP